MAALTAPPPTATMQSDVGWRTEFASAVLLPERELQTGVNAEKASTARRRAAFFIAGTCALAVLLAALKTNASTSRSATVLTLGLDVLPASASADALRPSPRYESAFQVPREELARRLRDISTSFNGSRDNLSRVFKELTDPHEVTNLSRGLGAPLRRLRLMTLPATVFLPQQQVKNASKESTERDLLLGWCGLGAENIVFSLGTVGLALDGMSKTCRRGKPDFSALECGGFFTAFLSELSWAAAAALTMPETCALKDIDRVGCAANSMSLVGTVFQGATDGIAAKINCFKGETTEVEAVLGGRRLGVSRGPLTEASERAEVVSSRQQGASEAGGTAPETALEAMGLLGRRRRHAGLRGTTSSKSRGHQPEDSPGGDDEDSAFPRGFDVAACYFTAENTAATVVDAVFQVISAVESCRKWQKTEEKEYQSACAAEISSFLSDIATVVSNAAIIASLCPVTAPPPTVPCIADWSDLVATLALFANWGASFGPDCLDIDE